MENQPNTGGTSSQAVPADDPARRLTHIRVDSPDADHIHLVGDTYTILVGGEATAGAYCLIDMLVPPGGGPAPHRHDFEEMFHVIHGSIELTFRGQTVTAKAGDTVNIPANAPHAFKNNSAEDARLLCICVPAGQEEFFRQVGTRAGIATEPAPRLSDTEMKAFLEKAQRLAPSYRTELLPPS